MNVFCSVPTLMRVALVMACAAALGGCSGEKSNAMNNAQPGAGGAFSGGLDAAVGVVTDAAREEEFAYELEALGTARANEAVEITPKVSNLVTAIRFREGQQVRRGEVLVQLDSVEVGADLDVARAALSESRSSYQRSQELYATQALSPSQLEQLEATLHANEARVTAAEKKLSDTLIRAPFDGRTGLRRVSVGSLVNAGTVITTLDDTSVIKLDFTVPETFVAILREGMPLTARSVAFPNRDFTGTIVSIDSRLDPTTRAITVRAALPNRDGLLKPGMFLNVRLQEERGRVLTIPEQALVPEEGRQYVFIVSEERARKREVSIGRRKPGRVEIISGLVAGDLIVVEGTQKVRDGARVQDVGKQVQNAGA
ncbi:MAG TPA: efflux RND transporter periplasmic adaptor subunit [Steroidobacteraceae bacterium]|nr:efflux RND transporter periplasmic adaptor subunit [Steroidobacteraceae bacterium]